MIKRIYTAMLAVCAITLMSFTGKIPFQDPVAAIVEEIAQQNVYEFGRLGYTGLKSKQYDRYLRLCEIASDEELLALTEHKNVVVRIYAFQACEKRRIEIPKGIVSKFERDNNKVKTIDGCEAFVSTVSQVTMAKTERKGSGSTKMIINGGPGNNR